MFSYGIMLLEVFTGKRPTDTMFIGDLNIRRWVHQSFPSDLNIHVVDDQLLLDASPICNVNDSILRVFELGLLCSCESPDQRISMIDVVVALKKIKKDYTKSVSRANPSVASDY
jgi:hypothetical protein